MISQHKTQRINEGSLPYYRRSQRLKYTMCLAVRASANNLLGAGLLACSQCMNRDITSAASSPSSIDVNSMWACWPISQSGSSSALCKYLMIGWSASTNNIIQGKGLTVLWRHGSGLHCLSTFFFRKITVKGPNIFLFWSFSI